MSFSPPIDLATMPASLCQRLEAHEEGGLKNLLRWLAPFTVPSRSKLGNPMAMKNPAEFAPCLLFEGWLGIFPSKPIAHEKARFASAPPPTLGAISF